MYVDWWHTAIPIIIEDHETAFNGFEYQFTTGKPLKNLKPTLNYQSIIVGMAVRNASFFKFKYA